MHTHGVRVGVWRAGGAGLWRSLAADTITLLCYLGADPALVDGRDRQPMQRAEAQEVRRPLRPFWRPF